MRNERAGLALSRAATSPAVLRAHLDFRAHRDPLDLLSQCVGQELIALVPAVEAHLLPEKARGDPMRMGLGAWSK